MEVEDRGLDSCSPDLRERIAWSVFSATARGGPEPPDFEQLRGEISRDIGEIDMEVSDLDALYTSAVTLFSDRVLHKIQTGLIANRSPYTRMNALAAAVCEACTEIKWETEPTPKGWHVFEMLEKIHGAPVNGFLTLYVYKTLSESEEHKDLDHSASYEVGQKTADEISQAISLFMGGKCDCLEFKKVLKAAVEKATLVALDGLNGDSNSK